MKIRSVVRIFFIIAGFMLVLSIVRNRAAYAGADYDPGLIYNGPYVSSSVYYHNEDPVGRKWILDGEEGKHFPEVANCPEARFKLRQGGFWRGRLNEGGSCGGKNAPFYRLAVGNWLNYRKSMVAD